MENNNSENNIGLDYTKTFVEYIEILKSWRGTLWLSSRKGTTAFLIEYLERIPGLNHDLEELKSYAPTEIVQQFENEYNKTMYLLDKCLAKSINKNLLPGDEETDQAIADILPKISNAKEEMTNMEEIEDALRAEDPTTREILKEFGISEERIESAIANGFTLSDVLDQPTSPTITNRK